MERWGDMNLFHLFYTKKVEDEKHCLLKSHVYASTKSQF
jgi:hypothetical protein